MAAVVPKRFVRSSALRLALGYAALFTASAVLLLAFVYWYTARYMLRQSDETIDAEIVGLADRYRLTGLSGLTLSIRERLDRRPTGSSIYLLTDPAGSPIVGNLDRWPSVAPDEDGFLDFDLLPAAGERPHLARAKPFVLEGGFRLLVGKDLFDLQSAQALLLRTTGWGVALTAALALFGGLVASRSRIRRIGAVNDVIGEVMAGDLSRRIPVEPTGDDIEELVEKLNRMLDELEKLVEGVRRVSDSIAHDLRTPLARLKTRLERLRRVVPEGTSGGPGAAGDGIDDAIEEADRLLATFAALLRIARIEAGERGRASFRDVDLTALVDDVAELYGPLVEEKGKKFLLHNSPGVAVSADRDMVFQAVVNLVDNALKHAAGGGRIELSLSGKNEGAEIVVADDGQGIPEEERGKVSERFYRLDRSRSTPGAGLGLSLVAAVAALHRGELRLEDNRPGLRAVLKLR
jgi:signal transduction histidine kinase